MSTLNTVAGTDPLDTPNCPICLRPMEAIEADGGVVMWSCGYGCDEVV